MEKILSGPCALDESSIDNNKTLVTRLSIKKTVIITPLMQTTCAIDSKKIPVTRTARVSNKKKSFVIQETYMNNMKKTLGMQ